MPVARTAPRRQRHRVAAGAGAVLAVLVAATQVVAIVPASWWGPVLDIPWLQYAVITLGVVRDELGIWVVVIAVVALALTVRATRARPTIPRRTAMLVAAAALIASGVTSTLLIAASVDAGAGVRPFLPAVPIRADAGRPDQSVWIAEVEGEELRADLYLPDEASAPAPVVVYVHGGGFDGGDKGPNAYNRYLAQQGYAVLDVQYRLARPDRPSWRIAVADVGCALTWVTRNAGTHRLDADRVALFGESAGGNLAYNAGYLAATGDLRPSCGSEQQLPTVRAVIGGYPAVDLTDRRTVFGRRLGERYVGGTPAQCAQCYAFTDPLTHVTADSPPTLVVQGTRDHLVLPEPVERFAHEVRRAGVPTRLVTLPASEHGIGDFRGADTWGTRAMRAAALQWLDTHLS